MGNTMADTARVERVRLPDFLKLIEELRALKNRTHTLDSARLEDQHRAALETAVKAAEKRAKSGSPEEIQRLQAEARRIVDDEHGRSKEILASKFQKLDHNLQALAHFLQDLGPVKELEARLAAQEDKLKKQEDEINIKRKVIAHEQEEVERDRRLVQAGEQAIMAKEKDLEAKLQNLDIVRRARELDQLKADLESKINAFRTEEMALEKMRDELNRDCVKLGEQRAELEKQSENLCLGREALDLEKQAMADKVAREMGATFEAFVRDMLRSPRPPA